MKRQYSETPLSVSGKLLSETLGSVSVRLLDSP